MGRRPESHELEPIGGASSSAPSASGARSTRRGRLTKRWGSAPALGIGLALGLLGAPGAARAEALPPEESEAEAGTPRPAAPDLRAGHFFVIGKASLVGPAGSIDSELAPPEVSDAGASFGGIVGIGLSRYAVLEAFGSYALLDGNCAGCKARSFDAGLGFSYHLAQGLAIDPWISYGVAFRSFEFEANNLLDLGSAEVSGSYTGLDFARIAIGADFYPVPGFGFGPFVELDLGTFVDRDRNPGDPGPDPGASVHAFFQLGVRVAIDPVSWFGHGPSTPTKSGRSAAPPSSGGGARPLSPRTSALVSF
jgi:hypothetical protein